MDPLLLSMATAVVVTATLVSLAVAVAFIAMFGVACLVLCRAHLVSTLMTS